jgi:NAD-dependent dihydropyrimidine dehydrogenase PreA subunit
MKKEAQEKIYAEPNTPTPSRPVIIDPDVCTGCNICVERCSMDVFIPNPEKGKPPIILYPDECWYEGHCLFACPTPGAIKFNHPLVMTREPWKDKATGKYFWVGMKNPPPPNPKPPV